MSVDETNEIKLLDAAVYPSRYIPRFIQHTWSAGKNVVITSMLLTMGCVSAVFSVGAQLSGAVFDEFATYTERRGTIKDGEKGVSCYSYSPILPIPASWSPINLYIHKIVKSDDGPLRASSGAFFYVVVKGSFIDTTETLDAQRTTYIEKSLRSVGSCSYVGVGDKGKITLQDGDGACWRLVIAFGRSSKRSIPTLSTGQVDTAPSPVEPKVEEEKSAEECDEKTDSEDEKDPLAM